MFLVVLPSEQMLHAPDEGPSWQQYARTVVKPLHVYGQTPLVVVPSPQTTQAFLVFVPSEQVLHADAEAPSAQQFEKAVGNPLQ